MSALVLLPGALPYADQLRGRHAELLRHLAGLLDVPVLPEAPVDDGLVDAALRGRLRAVRAGAGAALDGKVYVIGGQTEDRDGRQVYALDGRNETWEERAPLPEARFNMAAVTLGGKIYAMGGFSGTEERADVFVYDPAMDSWSEGTPLPAPNHTFGAVVFRGEIWTIGGRRDDEILHYVWIYDPSADRWRAGPALPEPMELVGAAVAGDEIHAIWESTYQIYDARSGRWRSGPRPLITRHGLKAFALAGSLYTIGGCTTDLHVSQVVERRGLG